MFKSLEDLHKAYTEILVGDDEVPIDQDLVAQLVKLARPGIQLYTDPRDDLPLGASRLYGVPDMPEALEWPQRPAYPENAKKQADIANGLHDKDYSWADAAVLKEIKKNAGLCCNVIDVLKRFQHKWIPVER